MDIDNLNDKEVKALINETKYFLEHARIQIPAFGKYKKDADVQGQQFGISYKFHAYRGNTGDKYSMHLRFSENNVHLVRLCINGSAHYNSDGSKAGPNHIHIYQINKNDEIEGYAYNLDSFPFDQDNSFVEAVEKFLKYINLKERSA